MVFDARLYQWNSKILLYRGLYIESFLENKLLYLIMDRLQISFLILNEFKWIN